MVGKTQEVAVTRVFSFGSGQTDPWTGENLAGKYVVVSARNAEICRGIMIAVFGVNWSMEYPSVKDFIEKNSDPSGRRKLMEHARFTFWTPSPDLQQVAQNSYRGHAYGQ